MGKLFLDDVRKQDIADRELIVDVRCYSSRCY